MKLDAFAAAPLHAPPLPLIRDARLAQSFDEHVEAAKEHLRAWSDALADHDRLLATLGIRDSWTLLELQQRAFGESLDAILAALQSVVAGLGAEDQRRAGVRLREALWPWFARAESISRCIRRPRGYAGDATMMCMLYERAWAGEGTFAKLLHRYPIDAPAGDAVRSRRARIATAAHECARSRGHARVLSLACGPAWEMHDMFEGPADGARFTCTLLDQDPEAIEIARGVVQALRACRAVDIRARFVCDSVRNLVETSDRATSLGRFDFIYSMGLFDYLRRPFAERLVATLYEMLDPGGTLLIGNFHVDNPSRTLMTYWLDWPLEYRTKDEFVALARALDRPEISVEFDPTRAQMFMRLVRQRGR